jgi:glycosyltransferase involved in cell wall biosynthesis
VVVPTRNRPHRLNGALASVLSQTHRNIEVIVVDDASDPPVEDLADADLFEDPRVRLQRLAGKSGAARARNVGLSLSNGELVAFLDDDDRWAPAKLATQVEYLDAHPRVGIVSCDHYVLSDEVDRPRRFRGPAVFGAEHLLWVNFTGSFSFVTARRALVEDELRIDESFPSVEDWDLWLRCSRLARPGVVREPLVHYVSHREARLTDAQSDGLMVFADKHGEAMSDACRAFHLAHRRMERTSRSRRTEVARAVLCAVPQAGVPLLVEQTARQIGRLTCDPGLPYRALASVIANRRTPPRGRLRRGRPAYPSV